MSLKIYSLFIICLGSVSINCCEREKYYSLSISADIERGSPERLLNNDFSSSIESFHDLPDRISTPSPVYIQRTRTRCEVIWWASKYIFLGAFSSAIGIGSYFLVENIMHEEQKVNDYLYGYNASLTALSNQIDSLTNLSTTILQKLSHM